MRDFLLLQLLLLLLLLATPIRPLSTVPFITLPHPIPANVALIPDGNTRFFTSHPSTSLYGPGTDAMTSAVLHLSSLRGSGGTRVENVVIYALSRDNFSKRPEAVTRRVLEQVKGAVKRVRGEVDVVFNGDLAPLEGWEGAVRKNMGGGNGGGAKVHVLLNYSGREAVENR